MTKKAKQLTVESREGGVSERAGWCLQGAGLRAVEKAWRQRFPERPLLGQRLTLRDVGRLLKASDELRALACAHMRYVSRG
jgi:hypothetical protein